MSQTINLIIDKFDNLSMKKITSLLFKLLINNEFCSVYVSEGSFGKVSINKIPKDFIIKLSNGKRIKLQNIAIKNNIDNFTDRREYEMNQAEISVTQKDKKHKTAYITKLDDIKNINVTKDSLITLHFLDNLGGEGLSSLLISKLFEYGITPHVPICGGFSNCEEQNLILYENFLYITKDGKTVSNLNDYLKYFIDRKIEITEDLVDYIIISLLHTLMIIQNNFRLLHSDMYFRNVFIKDCTDNVNYFNGIKMKNYDYIEYIIPKSKKGSLFLPFGKWKFILKVGDYGLSVMNYKNIVIINNSNEAIDRKSLVNLHYPNYPKGYDQRQFPDYFFIIRDLLQEFGGTSDLLIDLIRNVPILNKGLYLKYALLSGVNLNKTMNIADVLEMDIFDKYRIKPKKKYKILKVGNGKL